MWNITTVWTNSVAIRSFTTVEIALYESQQALMKYSDKLVPLSGKASPYRNFVR
jgi:hypothetical protein